MQFTDTRTYQNLARGFAGESQAGMRYQMAAKKAEKEGYKVLADTIRSIAKNETNHARIFFEFMLENGGNADNVVLDAGYPFHGKTLEECLHYAAKDESEEVEIYSGFAEIAKKEGFDEIAKRFALISQIEHNHRLVFNYLYKGVKEGTLYKNDTPLVWICSECGYMHTAKEAWKECPVCRHGQGYVQLHIPYQKEK